MALLVRNSGSRHTGQAAPPQRNIQANKSGPVFYKTDFHWNDWGGAVAFEEAINIFHKLGGKTNQKSELEFINIKLRDLGQAMSIPTIIPIYEQTITVNKVGGITSELEQMNADPFSFKFNNKVNNNIGSVVVIGDSYSGYGIHSYNDTNSGICDYFDELYFVHWDFSENILNKLPENTKLIIIESIESALPRMEQQLIGLGE